MPKNEHDKSPTNAKSSSSNGDHSGKGDNFDPKISFEEYFRFKIKRHYEDFQDIGRYSDLDAGGMVARHNRWRERESILYAKYLKKYREKYCSPQITSTIKSKAAATTAVAATASHLATMLATVQELSTDNCPNKRGEDVKTVAEMSTKQKSKASFTSFDNICREIERSFNFNSALSALGPLYTIELSCLSKTMCLGLVGEFDQNVQHLARIISEIKFNKEISKKTIVFRRDEISTNEYRVYAWGDVDTLQKSCNITHFIFVHKNKTTQQIIIRQFEPDYDALYEIDKVLCLKNNELQLMWRDKELIQVEGLQILAYGNEPTTRSVDTLAKETDVGKKAAATLSTEDNDINDDLQPGLPKNKAISPH